MASELKPVIVERTLRSEGGAARPVQLRLGMPRPSPKGDWECPYQIVGLGKSRSQVAYGLDGMQALLMAVEALRVTIEESGERLAWEGGENGDHGLPRVVPAFFGLAFAQRMSKLIDQEVERFSRRQAGKKRKSGGVRRRGGLANSIREKRGG
jgi:hypothetical protein